MIRRPMITEQSKSILRMISRISDMEFGEYKTRKLAISVQGISTTVEVKGRGNFFADERVMATFLNGFWPGIRIFTSQFKVRLWYGVFLRFSKKKLRVEFTYDHLKYSIPMRKYRKRMRRLAQFFAHMIYYGDGLYDMIYDIRTGISNLIVFPPESVGFTAISNKLIPLDFNPSNELFIEGDYLRLASSEVELESGKFKRESFRDASGEFLGTRVNVIGRRRADVIFAFNGSLMRIRISGDTYRIYRDSSPSRLSSKSLTSLVYSIYRFRGRKRYFVRKAIIILIHDSRYSDRFIDLGLLSYWLSESQTAPADMSHLDPRYIHLLKDEIKIRRFALNYFNISDHLETATNSLKSIMTKKLIYRNIINGSSSNKQEKMLYEMEAED